ncbi:hypothetical protein Scep_020182 [Stephania cephalantha]|uniref:Uncharacterized protein n=1 Tax=Stephania cephalantha TaxID=152367 RepID=A0AAP0IC92_9MAGN
MFYKHTSPFWGVAVATSEGDGEPPGVAADARSAVARNRESWTGLEGEVARSVRPRPHRAVPHGGDSASARRREPEGEADPDGGDRRARDGQSGERIQSWRRERRGGRGEGDGGGRGRGEERGRGELRRWRERGEAEVRETVEEKHRKKRGTKRESGWLKEGEGRTEALDLKNRQEGCSIRFEEGITWALDLKKEGQWRR